MKNFFKSIWDQISPLKNEAKQTVKVVEIPKPAPRKPHRKQSDYRYKLIPINDGKTRYCNFRKQQLPGKILIEGKQRFVIELNN